MSMVSHTMGYVTGCEAVPTLFGQLLLGYMGERGVGWTRLARKGDISRSYLYMLVRGDRLATASVVRRVGRGLALGEAESLALSQAAARDRGYRVD